MEEANKCLRLIPHSLLWGTCFGSAKKNPAGTGGEKKMKARLSDQEVARLLLNTGDK